MIPCPLPSPTAPKQSALTHFLSLPERAEDPAEPPPGSGRLQSQVEESQSCRGKSNGNFFPHSPLCPSGPRTWLTWTKIRLPYYVLALAGMGEGIPRLVCKGRGSRSHVPVPEMSSLGGVAETNSSELPKSGNFCLTQAPAS